MGQKITVTSLGDTWQPLARMVPQGLTPLGTLTRDGRAMAFGRDVAGEYWVFGTGRPEPLPKIRIQKGIAALTVKSENPLQGGEGA